jgi:hypothetical protein
MIWLQTDPRSAEPLCASRGAYTALDLRLPTPSDRRPQAPLGFFGFAHPIGVVAIAMSSSITGRM